MTTRILMVCLGNICRSPLAEGILQKLLKDQELMDIEVDSAGTAGHTAGALPDHRSLYVAKINGIELQHSARQIRRSDFKYFDYILVMDESNYLNVLKLSKSDEEKSKVHLITDFDRRKDKLKVVRDPYWGDLNEFIRTYEQLFHCCEGWIHFFLEEKKRTA